MSYVTSASKVKAEIEAKNKNKKKTDEINKRETKSIYPNLVAQFQEVGLNIRNADYNHIYDSVVEANYNKLLKLEQTGEYEVTKKISMMQRRIGVDRKTKKKKEFLTYHKLLHVKDKGSLEYQVGVDYSTEFRKKFDDEGNLITHIPTAPIAFYTIPYEGKEQVEKILNSEDQTEIDNVQFSLVTQGGKDYSCSEDEFMNCSFEELALRGRSGFNGGAYDSSFKLTDLSPKEKFDRGIR